VRRRVGSRVLQLKLCSCAGGRLWLNVQRGQPSTSLLRSVEACQRLGFTRLSVREVSGDPVSHPRSSLAFSSVFSGGANVCSSWVILLSGGSSRSLDSQSCQFSVHVNVKADVLYRRVWAWLAIPSGFKNRCPLRFLTSRVGVFT